MASNRKKAVRFNPACDGNFFSQKERREWFLTAIRTTYDSDFWSKDTVDKIVGNEFRLAQFARDVCRTLWKIVIEQEDQIAFSKMPNVADIIYANPATGFSFCEYVAKRLELMRKAGKLKPRNPPINLNGKKLPENTRLTGGTEIGYVG